ncbi:alpha/beta fold hydrolase, partial [Halomonas sp. BBD48]|nr:alpha/beta fold hydrolase [Halomonas sp. BBD48]
MHADYRLEQGRLERRDQCVAWRHLHRYGEGGKGTLLLLHGAGVAGEATWQPMLGHLDAWQDIVIPDLRGMGQTCHPDGQERSFTLDEVVADIEAVLDARGCDRLDVVGYSFGGLVAMRLKQRLGARVARMGLIEPALLEREDQATMIQVREAYAEAAERIRQAETPEAGIVAFLDLIAPHRSRNPRAERLSVTRLAHRPLGFANALDCVTQAVRYVDREALLQAQEHVISIVGSKSLEAMKRYHALLD